MGRVSKLGLGQAASCCLVVLLVLTSVSVSSFCICWQHGRNVDRVYLLTLCHSMMLLILRDRVCLYPRLIACWPFAGCVLVYASSSYSVTSYLVSIFPICLATRLNKTKSFDRVQLQTLCHSRMLFVLRDRVCLHLRLGVFRTVLPVVLRSVGSSYSVTVSSFCTCWVRLLPSVSGRRAFDVKRTEAAGVAGSSTDRGEKKIEPLPHMYCFFV